MKNYKQIRPYHCLKKAYEIGKHIRKIKKNYLSHRTVFFHRKRSWQSILFYTNTELNNCIFKIYLSLLGYRISLYFMDLCQFLRFHNPPRRNKKFINRSRGRDYKNHSIPIDLIDGELIREINRKLTWIEVTLNDLYIWKRYYLLSSPSSDGKERNDHSLLGLGTKGTKSIIIVHESIGLLPRSITRTISRFKAELTNQSKPLILREFGLTRYQALASLQYIGCLISIPSIISIFFQQYFSEPLIRYWWNNEQSQIFLAPDQEDKTLEELEGIEELSRLDKIIENSSFGTQSQGLGDGIHEKTIESVKNHNDNSIEIISHSLTDIIYIITLSGLFIAGEERLVISNSWAQELFYSLSDTMKAFFILLLTDSCIGFHSPHGWELAISFFLEHFGFVRDGRIISCFVSTFPVVSDTVLKYLIFRHLNRISPSIVATYHTMNE
uniref:Potassium/proton antiporter CemA n=1 Tax=Aneura pinguis TaxID=39026 RepID=A0A221SCS7_ANEPI|nr:envelope membrane protein [Aneura pinguis]ASN73811.1 envelope membrane protein [Aneura pinguis]WGO59283.1 envelope membrane protein [Aneura pinguis]WGO59455.1 envelope membrane protein [Aneura pinguis]